MHAARAIYSRPILESGDTVFCVWPSWRLGSFVTSGGQLALENTGKKNMYVMLGPIPAYTSDRNAVHIDDITKPSYLLQSKYYLGIDPRGLVATMKQDITGLTQDARFTYSVNADEEWTAAELVYAREYIRLFGIQIPPGSLHEPFVTNRNVTYIVGHHTNHDTRGLLMWA